jgi:hypothetical protein
VRFRRQRKEERHAAPVSPAANPVDLLAEARRLRDAGRRPEAIDLLQRSNREARDLEVEVELCRLRHQVGIELVDRAGAAPRFATPSSESLVVDPVSRLPEVPPDRLDAEVLRAAILGHGALIVRGLLDEATAEGLAAGIDRSFEVRASVGPGGADADGYYRELEPEPPYRIIERKWVEVGGGVLAVDSPRLLYTMLDAFERVGLDAVIEQYLGEPPAMSVQKSTLRKAMPEVAGAWHQDGRFLGDVRSLNVWLSLSRCGDVAPSLDVVPRRFDTLVAASTEGTVLDYQVSQAVAEEVAGELGIVRPIFDPGDALLFDEMFLHQTGSDPSMPNPRYSIESWFFGPSAFPKQYIPVAL